MLELNSITTLCVSHVLCIDNHDDDNNNNNSIYVQAKSLVVFMIILIILLIVEKALFSLPAHKGECRSLTPVESAQVAYSASRASTASIIADIKGEEEFSVEEHIERDSRSTR